MHYASSLVAAALVLAPLASASGLYSKDSAVLQVDGKDFGKLIKNSRKSSIVEFYAPWCGHCKSLKPAYEKAAKNLEGLVNIAAVNCDDEKSKEFCGRMGIKGFPTLKSVRVTGMQGKPIIQDYNGARTAAGIVEAAKGLIPNSVQKVTDDALEKFLSKNNETAKAILFSDKGTIAALTKVLGQEYSLNLPFAQIHDKETKAVSTFGITEYPTLLVLPGGIKDPVFYNGKFEKSPMNAFLSQYAEFFDPAVHGPNAKRGKADKKEEKDKKQASSDSSTLAEASATAETVEDPELTASPNPIVDEDAPTPVPVPVTPAIASLATYEEIQASCLGPKTKTCVIALLDETVPEDATAALGSLAALAQKHKARGDHLFPFFQVPTSNPGHAALKSSLALKGDGTQLVAVNGKKAWWRLYSGEKGYGEQAVEDFVDGIRFGEGKKEKLPADLIVEAPVVEKPTLEDDDLMLEDDFDLMLEDIDFPDGIKVEEVEELSEEEAAKYIVHEDL